jgi:hypothetical protein
MWHPHRLFRLIAVQLFPHVAAVLQLTVNSQVFDLSNEDVLTSNHWDHGCGVYVHATLDVCELLRSINPETSCTVEHLQTAIAFLSVLALSAQFFTPRFSERRLWVPARRIFVLHRDIGHIMARRKIDQVKREGLRYHSLSSCRHKYGICSGS